MEAFKNLSRLTVKLCLNVVFVWVILPLLGVPFPNEAWHSVVCERALPAAVYLPRIKKRFGVNSPRNQEAIVAGVYPELVSKSFFGTILVRGQVQPVSAKGRDEASSRSMIGTGRLLGRPNLE